MLQYKGWGLAALKVATVFARIRGFRGRPIGTGSNNFKKINKYSDKTQNQIRN